MAGYLQRVAGYCLTGRTDEQVFFFLHGPGANGKTVFLEVLADVLGSYARTAPLDTFMATRADRQPNDLAGLDGARMVIATETEAGRPWAEARIKAITGGDRIAVRRLYGEFFETTPGYKLLIAGNHRPRLTGGGEAWPGGCTDSLRNGDPRARAGRPAPREARQPSATASSAGCWTAAAPGRRCGLRPPRRCATPSPSYFDSEDFVGQWIAECCEVGDGRAGDQRRALRQLEDVGRGARHRAGQCPRPRGAAARPRLRAFRNRGRAAGRDRPVPADAAEPSQ